MSIAADSRSPSPNATRATFSLEHYEHLVACGAFAGEFEQRVELLWGEIVEMAPIGPPHCDDLDRLARWSFESTRGLPIRVRVQSPIRLPDAESEPEPDIAWVIERDYRDRHPNPEEVLLVIEVAESSLATDRGSKLAAYATAGIAEYWIVNLPDRVVEVCREPTGGGYANRRLLKSGDKVSPLAAADAGLDVDRVF